MSVNFLIDGSVQNWRTLFFITIIDIKYVSYE